MRKKGESPISRVLFHTDQKISKNVEAYDCEYCNLKRKFSGTNEKCIAHAVIDSKSNSPASK